MSTTTERGASKAAHILYTHQAITVYSLSNGHCPYDYLIFIVSAFQWLWDYVQIQGR